ncbi:lipopolysaccharide biosynthesis protein [Bremerella cremea]|uniref:Lipopolysaccharide biosynthesis protein n=1 Tax=Bremerella cremea TaxID=1031537 RepID=A0A368KRE2_9BACT|nr:lipopolysaccharide biosynthesis protein [Bremerella cremea]RCS46351.1 lipopolysaccharide biosynthesis protein [Bremerella cremea]
MPTTEVIDKLERPSPTQEIPTKLESCNPLFDSKELHRDLGRKAVRGSGITILAQVARFVLKLGSTAILARFLTPDDFGLIAMVMVLIAFVEMFKDAGLAMATIQREKITHQQISTLFWLNTVVGVGVALIVAAVAPGIAWFYGDYRLVAVVMVLATSFAFSGVVVQHQALLRRNMQLGKLAIIDVVGMFVGVVVAVAMAAQGWGYWALVGWPVATSISSAITTFLLVDWRPGAPSFKEKVGDMAGFGLSIAGYQAMNHFARNTDNIAIGAYWGAASLGYYSKAYGLVLLAWVQVLAPISSVVQPGLCRLVSKPEEFKRLYRDALAVVGWMSFVVIAITCIHAKLVFRIVMGPGWDESAYLYMLLAPAAVVMSIRVATTWVYVAYGTVRRQLNYSVASGLVLMVGSIIACFFGVYWVAIAVSVIQVAQFIVSIPICFADTDMSWRDAAEPILVPLFFVSGVSGVLLLLTTVIDELPLLLIGVTSYSLLCLIVLTPIIKRHLS